MLKIHISSLWGSFSISVRCFDVVHKFLVGFEKYRVVPQNTKGLRLLFYRKMSIHEENCLEIRIHEENCYIKKESSSTLVKR
jgi:hypothetical protein